MYIHIRIDYWKSNKNIQIYTLYTPLLYHLTMSSSEILCRTSMHFNKKKLSHFIWCNKYRTFDWHRQRPSSWNTSSMGFSSGAYRNRFKIRIFLPKVCLLNFYSLLSSELLHCHKLKCGQIRENLHLWLHNKKINVIEVPWNFPIW